MELDKICAESKAADQASIDEWTAAFKAADADGSGSLDINELYDVVKAKNKSISFMQVADTFVAIDGPGGDKKITLDEFLKGLAKIDEKYEEKKEKSKKNTIEEWKAAFKEADKGRNGTLEYDEFRELLKKYNCKITESQVKSAFTYIDGAEGDSRISCKEFIAGLERFQEQMRELEEKFKKFDVDKSGYLDKAELKKIMELSEHHKYTDAEINDILIDSDKNGDGKISFEEFFEACS